jgi:hypothetical protein
MLPLFVSFSEKIVGPAAKREAVAHLKVTMGFRKDGPARSYLPLRAARLGKRTGDDPS